MPNNTTRTLTAVALLLLTACALWELGTPVKPKRLRPCVGTYVYPDSAGTCDEKGER